ncbi:MAG: YfhO family protein [Alphaproteobacteria bacterium]|nr:YfhO family protein [Alphaproteobacteria bacterium]
MSAREPLSRWPVAAALFLGLSLARAPDLLTGQRVWWSHDLRHHHHPWRHWAASLWAQGEVPLWSPEVGAGFPLAADGQAGVFYLPRILLGLLLPSHLAMSADLALHGAWAGLGAWWLARVLGMGGTASALAGVVFALSGFMEAHLTYAGFYAACAWAPWAVGAALTLARGGGLGAAAGFALSVAAVWLAGHPQAAAMVSLAALLAFAAGRPPLVAWAKAGAAAALGLAAASVQLAASRELAQQSAREGGVDLAFAGIGSLPPQELINAVLPRFWGWERPADLPLTYIHKGVAYFGTGETHWEDCFYLGFPVLLLALNARRRGWWALGGVGLVLMLGRFTPVWGLLHALPGFAYFRFPARFGLWVTLAAAVLAAAGLDALLAAPTRSAFQRLRLRALALAVPLLIFGGAARLVLGLVRDPAHQLLLDLLMERPDALQRADAVVEGMLWNGSWGLVAPTLALGALALWASVGLRWPARRLGYAALALVAVDLGGTMWNYNPRTDATLTSTPPATASWIEPGTRVAVVDRVQPPALDRDLMSASLSLLWGARDVIVLSPLRLMRHEALLAAAGLDVGLDHGSTKARAVEQHLQLAEMMGIRHLLTVHTLTHPRLSLVGTEGPVNVYRVEGAFERAFIVPCAVEVADTDQAIARLQALPLDHVAVIEGGRGPGCGEGEGAARILEDTPHRVAVEVEADQPSLLVLTETHYPGWRATVDGVPAEILRTNVSFWGVVVPRGASEVVFTYHPDWWWLARVAGVAHVLMGVLALVAVARRVNLR